MYTDLKKNLLVIAQGEPARIVGDLRGSQIKVEFCNNSYVATIDISELKLLPVENYLPNIGSTTPLDTGEISLLDLNKASERAVAFDKYLAGEISGKEAMAELKLSKSQFYRLINKYDKRIGITTLLPKSAGRVPGEKFLDEKIEEVIAAAIEKSYTGKAASYAHVYEEVRAECSRHDLTIPSLSTVTKRVKSLGKKALHLKKHGREATDQKFRPKPGKHQVTRPLEQVQIDHTLVDCILVDEETRQPLFRPWLTILIDEYSRVILGYYIAFHNPSALSVACAITHAFLPKQDYLKNIGRESLRHPFYGFPLCLAMDNAKEFRSNKLQVALMLYQVETAYRREKHWGGQVERLIGTMMTSHVHFLPGSTMSNIVTKGDYNSEKESALTIQEFIKWFAGQVELYNYKTHSSLGCPPAKKWADALKTEAGEEILPRVITDPFRFRLDFMPEALRSIRVNGVHLFNRTYWAPELRMHIGMKHVVIKYDPYNLGFAWARINGVYIHLRFADQLTEPLSYEEHLIETYHKHTQKSKKMDPHSIATRDENQSIVEQSISQTKKARRQAKAEKSFSEHTLNQHFDGAKSVTPSSDKPKIDFSKAPTVFRSEDD